MTDKRQSLRSKTIASLLWKTIEKFGQQLIQLVVSIILARLIEPRDYGVVGIITVFISIATVFVEYGLSYSLIRSKEINEADINTTFLLNIILGFILYVVLFLSAPFIADFYENSSLTSFVRILSITIIIGSISTVNNAILSRNLEFKKIFISNTIGTLISGIVGVILALKGIGIWALIVQQMTLSIITAVGLQISTKYVPRFRLSKQFAIHSVKFSWKVLASTLLGNFSNNIQGLLIGKIYSSEALAFYNKGQQFPGIINMSTDFSFQKVMLPVYSISQDDRVRMKSIMRKALITSSFILCPAMFGLCAVSAPVVRLLLGETWLGAVPFMQILCIAGAFNTPASVSGQAINAIGRSDVTLKIEIILRTISVVLIFIAAQVNIYAIAITQIIINILNFVLRARSSKKFFDYGYRDQLLDLLPSFSVSAIMSFLVLIISNFLNMQSLNTLADLAIQITIGAIFYVATSFVFKLKGLKYIREIINDLKP